MDKQEYLTLGTARDLARWQDRALYRAGEMLPGILAWLTLIGVVVLSFRHPVAISIFIIIFDVYWLTKTMYLTLHLRASFRKVRTNMKVQWAERLEKLALNEYQLANLSDWRELYHLIILPTYKESVELIVASVESLAAADYPKNRMLVVLAQEQRAGVEHNHAIAEAISTRFTGQFFELLITEHPASIIGEQAGKGANCAFAAKIAQRTIIDRLEIPHQRVLVSSFDVDTVVYPGYFACLTYTFLTARNPLRASYQPIPFFINNIWEAPAFARVVSFASTFWQIIQQERPENLITFSSHSMPLTALIDIGYWQVNMVSEDSRVFWQCLLRYDGDYRVVPMYFPVSMDANAAPTFWQTMLNVYKQHRRWGYGTENVPYFLFGFIKNRAMPLKRKLFYTITILEGYWSWATNAIILFLLGWLPLIVGGPAFYQTIISFNLPVLTRTISGLALIGLVTSAMLSIAVLPPRPPQYGRYRHIMMVLQWLLFPLTTILLGAIPGLEAQTRLMLGKYMGFWVTPKYRKEYNK